VLATPAATVADLGPALRRCSTCGEEYPAAFKVCPMDSTPLGVGDPGLDPLLGVVLSGTFRITRVLGRGGMGRLYEAEHTRLDRRFAVKVLHESQQRRRDSVARFRREARSLSRIRSPHVLRVVDVSKVPDGRAALVTELLEGEDLKTHLERIRRLAVSEAIPLARQLCRGVAAAHAEGVIHRDLKPSNLFLVSDADGKVHLEILDFGVAKLDGDDDLTRTGAVVGTPAYMAPEQALGSKAVDRRADVYGIGAVLYRMLTGRAPYAGSEPARMLSRLLREAPTRPRSVEPSIPAGLEEVVQRAMARDPDDRYADALELERALALYGGAVDESYQGSLAGGPADGTVAFPPGTVARGRALDRAARRIRPLSVAGGVGLALLAGATAAFAGAGVLGLSTPVLRGVAAATALATGALLARALHKAWAQAPELRRTLPALLAPLLGAAVAVGAWELLVRGLEALALVDGVATPRGFALRFLLALTGAALALKHRPRHRRRS
jgi:tRNA A-37 threonylcarbamoyl transferase component Bud32